MHAICKGLIEIDANFQNADRSLKKAHLYLPVCLMAYAAHAIVSDTFQQSIQEVLKFFHQLESQGQCHLPDGCPGAQNIERTTKAVGIQGQLVTDPHMT